MQDTLHRIFGNVLTMFLDSELEMFTDRIVLVQSVNLFEFFNTNEKINSDTSIAMQKNIILIRRFFCSNYFLLFG